MVMVVPMAGKMAVLKVALMVALMVLMKVARLEYQKAVQLE
jgi:hypothetical protein